MKRIISSIIAGCILISLCACTHTPQKAKEPIKLYYRTSSEQYEKLNNIITAEVRDAHGHSGDFSYLLQDYLSGPRTEACYSPFPSGTKLEKLDIISNKAIIVLSENFSSLSGSDLMVACACVSKTVIELTGVQAVQINSLNNKLNGQDSITMNLDSFFLMDNFTFDDSDAARATME